MDIKQYVTEKARKAKAASRQLANISTEIKNDALFKMAKGLEAEAAKLISENRKDLIEAEKKGLSRAMIDRLTLTPDRIKAMADGLREVAALPDPVGEVIKMRRRPNGMEVGRMRVPIGLIGIIYESRPNVTADSAALCLKSGNGVILRAGPKRYTRTLPLSRFSRRPVSTRAFPTARSRSSRIRPRLRHGDAQDEPAR